MIERFDDKIFDPLVGYLKDRFFQTDKDTGSQKGIVLLNVQELP